MVLKKFGKKDYFLMKVKGQKEVMSITAVHNEGVGQDNWLKLIYFQEQLSEGLN